MKTARADWIRAVARHRRLVLLVVVLTMLGLTPLAHTDCGSAHPGAQVAIPVCDEGPDGVPSGPVPTFTEKPFWIVLGLVVLGWLVLAADWPEES